MESLSDLFVILFIPMYAVSVDVIDNYPIYAFTKVACGMWVSLLQMLQIMEWTFIIIIFICLFKEEKRINLKGDFDRNRDKTESEITANKIPLLAYTGKDVDQVLTENSAKRKETIIWMENSGSNKKRQIVYRTNREGLFRRLKHCIIFIIICNKCMVAEHVKHVVTVYFCNVAKLGVICYEI